MYVYITCTKIRNVNVSSRDLKVRILRTSRRFCIVPSLPIMIFANRLLTRHVFKLQAVHFTGRCVFIVFTCFGVWPCMQGVSDRSIHSLLLCGLKTNKFYTLGYYKFYTPPIEHFFLNLINYFPKFVETQCQ